MEDRPDVAVENVFLIVVPQLHDLVADAVLTEAGLEPLALRVQPFLELQVQVLDTDEAFIHGADDLDLGR